MGNQVQRRRSEVNTFVDLKEVQHGGRHALVICISEYKDDLLPGALVDRTKSIHCLSSLGFHVSCPDSERPGLLTLADLRLATQAFLQDVSQEVKARGTAVVVVMVSCHATMCPSSHGFPLLHTSCGEKFNFHTELMGRLNQIPSQEGRNLKSVLVFDCCRLNQEEKCDLKVSSSFSNDLYMLLACPPGGAAYESQEGGEVITAVTGLLPYARPVTEILQRAAEICYQRGRVCGLMQKPCLHISPGARAPVLGLQAGDLPPSHTLVVLHEAIPIPMPMCASALGKLFRGVSGGGDCDGHGHGYGYGCGHCYGHGGCGGGCWRWTSGAQEPGPSSLDIPEVPAAAGGFSCRIIELRDVLREEELPKLNKTLSRLAPMGVDAFVVVLANPHRPQGRLLKRLHSDSAADMGKDVDMDVNMGLEPQHVITLLPSPPKSATSTCGSDTTKFALVVCASKYDSKKDLRSPVSDKQRSVECLSKLGFQVRCPDQDGYLRLSDLNAAADKLVSDVRDAVYRNLKKTFVTLVFSSHGQADLENQFFSEILASDQDRGQDGFRMSGLVAALDNIPAECSQLLELLVISDVCRLRPRRQRGAPPLPTKCGFYTILSCDLGEEAWDLPPSSTLVDAVMDFLPYALPLTDVLGEAAMQFKWITKGQVEREQNPWVCCRPLDQVPVLGDTPPTAPSSRSFSAAAPADRVAEPTPDADANDPSGLIAETVDLLRQRASGEASAQPQTVPDQNEEKEEKGKEKMESGSIEEETVVFTKVEESSVGAGSKKLVEHVEYLEVSFIEKNTGRSVGAQGEDFEPVEALVRGCLEQEPRPDKLLNELNLLDKFELATPADTPDHPDPLRKKKLLLLRKKMLLVRPRSPDHPLDKKTVEKVNLALNEVLLEVLGRKKRKPKMEVFGKAEDFGNLGDSGSELDQLDQLD